MNNKSGAEGRGRAKSRGAKRPDKNFSAEGDKPKKYKAKRSFTKNKSFRETKEVDFEKKPKRAFGSFDDNKPYKKDFGDKPKRSFRASDDKDLSKDKFSPKTAKKSSDRKPFRERSEDTYAKSERSPRGPREERPMRSSDERPRKTRPESEGGKAFKKVIRSKEDKFAGFKKASTGIKHGSIKPERNEKPGKRRLTKPRRTEEGDFTKRVKYDEFEEGKAFSPQTSRESFPKKGPSKKPVTSNPTSSDGLIRLNKYLSNAGIASRRDADNLILSGTVKVNGVVVDKLGTKINPSDKVTYGDSAVKTERKVYLLLNKPKDYITTVDDPRERKTVMELISGVCRERIYPVGRLDRNTTGLLLFTNDGEMTTKLTHPKFGIKKIYHVSLNKGLKPEDFKAIIEGVELEDGLVKADDLAFVGEGKKEVGIEIHSGRNRIVRRIFEHLGYDVLKLDRVVFAGLTKKDLPRGKHRFLTAKEISFLQMIG